ncbi:MAG: DNA mismatch repair protein MutS, partial [Methyloligellaceae bacterium]
MTEQAGQAKRARTSPASGVVTPMMVQFLEIKAAYADCLLFYRMGDFYELFFEDAEQASRALGIALTKRGRHNGEDIPMCGVPVHTADDYLQRLIQKGFRVAVCEQTEDPAEAKKRGAKAVVRREVVRLVTPGTLTEESLLDARANNFLTAIFRAPTSTADPAERFALASLDISTGEFVVGEIRAVDLGGELVRLAPSEVVVGEELASDAAVRDLIESAGAAVTPVPRPYFDSLAGERALKEKLQVATIEGFGTFARAELAATAALLKYVDITQLGHQPALRPPRRVGPSTVLVIDAATRASLELVRSIRGERKGTLLQAVDRTVTGAGARELAARLASPLTDPKAIARRLDAVSFLRDDAELRGALRRTMAAAPDIARALARLTLGRGGPRDLGAIRSGLDIAGACAGQLTAASDVMGLPETLGALAADLAAVGAALGDELAAALDDALPVQKRDGGFVRPGYRSDLDENRTLRDESRQVLAALQASYADLTGVKSLKVRHNNVLGYFVEVTGTHGDKLLGPPLNEIFIHRQTLASAVRFTTAELGETEAKITAAADRALAIELEVFSALVDRVAAQERQLGQVAAALAELDHHGGLAELAEEQVYVRPAIDGGPFFHIEGGRHPVVEQALVATDAGPFVEND